MEEPILDVLEARFEAAQDKPALITEQETLTYSELRKAVSEWDGLIANAAIQNGDVVVLKGDFGRDGIAALFALLRRQAIVVMLAPASFD